MRLADDVVSVNGSGKLTLWRQLKVDPLHG